MILALPTAFNANLDGCFGGAFLADMAKDLDNYRKRIRGLLTLSLITIRLYLWLMAGYACT